MRVRSSQGLLMIWFVCQLKTAWWAAILAALAFWFVVVQGGPAYAQQAAITLACKGVVWDTRGGRDKREPVSLGIVVDFTTRTVQGGYGPPGMCPATITDADAAQIRFEGGVQDGPVAHGIDGFIDRVTGDVAVTTSIQNTQLNTPATMTYYQLKCIPTRHMF